jgi:dCTP diphosphatase
MSDRTTTIDQLRSVVKTFVDERDWRQFHTPKNLAMSLAIETAELMEHFQWTDTDETARRINDPARRAQIAEEVADVCCYLLSLVNALELDLSEAVRAKMLKNARKYPVSEFKGRFERTE